MALGNPGLDEFIGCGVLWRGADVLEEFLAEDVAYDGRGGEGPDKGFGVGWIGQAILEPISCQGADEKLGEGDDEEIEPGMGAEDELALGAKVTGVEDGGDDQAGQVGKECCRGQGETEVAEEDEQSQADGPGTRGGEEELEDG